MRLASAILIGFGVSNLLPLFFTYWIGTSELSPPDLTDPARVASLLSNPATTNTVVRQIRLNLSADTTKLLASYGSETNQAARDRVVGMLTNLFNQSLTNPALRTAAALPGFAAGPATAASLRTAQTPLEKVRLNRLILQDAFPEGLRPIHHAREAEPAIAKFYLFLVANLALQGSLLWAFFRLLRDEGLSWSQFLRGTAPSVSGVVPFAIAAGAVSTVAMLALSGLSTWLLTLFDHAPRLQQPLVILQQARAPLEKFFFAYVALLGAPFFEETVFRGILYPALRQFSNPRFACLVSAGVFGLIHGDIEKFLPLALFGVILVRVYERTGTLVAPMLTHACFNSINFALFLHQESLQTTVQNPPL